MPTSSKRHGACIRRREALPRGRKASDRDLVDLAVGVAQPHLDALPVHQAQAARIPLGGLGLPEAAARVVDLLDRAFVQFLQRDDALPPAHRACLLARLLESREVAAANLVAHEHAVEAGAEAVEEAA